jgi:hypothetical protein
MGRRRCRTPGRGRMQQLVEALDGELDHIGLT